MQTEVAWTCGKKFDFGLFEGIYEVGGGGKGPVNRLRKSWQNMLFVDMRLLKVYPRGVHDRKKWRAIGWLKVHPAAPGTPP